MQIEIQNLTQDLKNQALKFDQLQNSRSWRITMPLRKLKSKISHSGLGTFRKVKKIKNSQLYNNEFYLRNNPDVRLAKMNPIKHYFFHGGFEGRKPSPDFDSAFHIENNPDVKMTGMNPLVHNLLLGKEKSRKQSIK